MPIRVIALDLEGTLVHSALEPHPRPGLAAFLDRCRALAERVVLFTGVEETVARRVVERLAREGHVPGWFGAIEIVRWEGPHKDLAYVEGVAVEEVLLVDDMESWIVAGQR
ncbi:MAG TPA: NIF family HAD-type phosphatase, partial [Gemmatimonadales bacterium]|nr:NIF family HAD-type phosphatase [Gemmatimonadales bacterium]